MSANSHPLSLNILRSYYPVVKTLGDYLHDAIAFDKGHNDIGLIHETDSYVYRRLLDSCIVTTYCEPEHPMLAAPVMTHLREILERAQVKLLSKGCTPNVLTAGYRLDQRRAGDIGPGPSMLRNYFVNTMITVFEGADWAALYERVGADVMFHLLTETSMFIALPNNCYCQLTGEPIINFRTPGVLHQPASDTCASAEGNGTLKRTRDGKDVGEPARPTKRLKVSHILQPGTGQPSGRIYTKAPAPVTPKTPADVTIPRARLFFSRPNRAPHSEKITFSLPDEHVLNRLHALFSSPPSRDPAHDVRRQFERARHLAKYIFPRQYGLPHPFASVSADDAYNVTDADRELQIKALGPCKTPKRLHEALDLVEKTIWRHGKCAYKALLQKTCPSKLQTKEHVSLDETIILEMLSESTQPYSQTQPNTSMSTASDGRSLPPSGVSAAAAQVKQKPRFAEFMCSYAEVFRFAVAATRAVIPPAFWGSAANFKLVTRHIKTFVALRRYETLALHTLLQGLRTSDCGWLAPHGAGARAQQRVSASDARKRLELVQDFVFWYFDGFLLPLLKAHFYVTESGAFRNRVLYFRHDDWQTLCRPLVARLSAETFQRLSATDAEEILRQRKLGFSFVRLLPKETGVRPIVNLRRKKVGSGQYQQSINQVLKAAFLILQYEKTSQSKLFGASVLGPNEIYTKLKGFKTRLLQRHPSGTFPKLYFVKLDVQACFDTIEQTKLLGILRAVLSEEAYTIQRYGEVGVNTGHVNRKFVKKAVPADDHPHFLLHATRLAESLRHVIFVDQVTYPTVRREEVLALLEQHITDNIVKIGKDYYRQIVGIPQGSVLSTLLCSFFYGDLERRYLQFTDNAESVLLRLIDDYLFVTTSYEDAKRFLDVMKKGHPEYGCFISKDKTLTNFEDGTLGNIVDPTHKSFPWCGFMIDMQDLSVSKDYSRYHDTFLSDSLTVDRGRRPGVKFTQKMLQLSQFTSHVVFNDPGLNSTHTIHKNIYQNFLLTAMKMHHYVRSWRPDAAERRAAFLQNVIRQMIRYTYSTMRNKARGRVSRAVGGRCETRRNVVEWLGTHAFHAVLSRKSHDYAGVIRSLEFELGLPRARAMKRRFGRVTREGRVLFSLLSF